MIVSLLKTDGITTAARLIEGPDVHEHRLCSYRFRWRAFQPVFEIAGFFAELKVMNDPFDVSSHFQVLVSTRLKLPAQQRVSV